MAPLGRVVDVAAEEAIDGRCGQETHIQAAVVAACQTGFTLIADQVRLDGNAVSDLVCLDGRMHGEDYASGLVAKDVIVLDHHGPNAAGVPEVDVRSVKGQDSRGTPTG